MTFEALVEQNLPNAMKVAGRIWMPSGVCRSDLRQEAALELVKTARRISLTGGGRVPPEVEIARCVRSRLIDIVKTKNFRPVPAFRYNEEESAHED